MTPQSGSLSIMESLLTYVVDVGNAMQCPITAIFGCQQQHISGWFRDGLIMKIVIIISPNGFLISTKMRIDFDLHFQFMGISVEPARRALADRPESGSP